MIDPERQTLSPTEAKAVRLVKEGRVHITWVADGNVAGHGIVDGDTDCYQSWFSPAGRACTCPAGQTHRDCSHAKAVELAVMTPGALRLELELAFDR